MPNFYKMNLLNDDNLQLQLRKKGFLKNIFKKCKPYLTGDILDLELKIKSKSNIVKQYTYEWQLQDISPETKAFRVVTQSSGSFNTNPKGKTNIQLNTHLIHYEAEYHLILTLNKE